MKISELMKISDSYTDETLTTVNATNFVTKCISVINARLGIALPFFVSSDANYIAISPSWQYNLFIPYLNYSVKMNDSSLNEAQMYLGEFERALSEFKSQMTEIVDSSYLNGKTGVYEIDTSDAIDLGWFGTPRDGGL